MVNSIAHLGIGLLVAFALGLKEKQRWTVAFLSILPDLDFASHIIFALIRNSVSHATRNQLFYLLAHREFMHSLLFVLIVTLFLWAWKKDRLLTGGGFAAIFLHVYLDYATSWKMHPFHPFNLEASTLGAIYFFDPLVNLLPLLPVFIVLVEELKRRGKWKKKFGRFCAFVRHNRKKLYMSLIAVLLFFFIAAPLAKFILLNHVSELEGAHINYSGAYPGFAGKFLCAYSFNSTHYKILEISYCSGIEKSAYIKKISVNEDFRDDSWYAARASKLYGTGLPQEIDYPVYTVSEDKGVVTVTLKDARSTYVRQWAYFETVYRFVFDKESKKYVAYASFHRQEEEKLPENWFE